MRNLGVRHHREKPAGSPSLPLERFFGFSDEFLTGFAISGKSPVRLRIELL